MGVLFSYSDSGFSPCKILKVESLLLQRRVTCGAVVILYHQRAVRPELGGVLVSEFYELIFKKGGFYPYTSYFFKKLTKRLLTFHIIKLTE